jgi:hypothetical protein
MKNFFIFLVICFFLNNCGGGYYQDPAKYDYQLTELMKKHALQNLDYHAVIHASSSYEKPYVYSSISFKRAKENGLNKCSRTYRDCFVYKLKYLGHDPYTGFIYNENDKKKVKPKKIAKIKKTETKKKEENKKKNNEEESLEEILKSYFGNRKIDNIEGLWGYRRDDEKEARIYLMIKSDEYLYQETVIYHPIRAFEGKISTKLIKKIDKNTYQTKATWQNGDKIDERDGIIKIIDKFKLKFETSRYCYSSTKDCLKAGTVYKKKIWPSKTYADDANLTENQTEILKKFLD